MNAHVEIVSLERAIQYLSETTRSVKEVPGHTVEEAVEALEAHFRSRLHYKGSFSTKSTPWGFLELTFAGLVFPGTPEEQYITHTIVC